MPEDNVFVWKNVDEWSQIAVAALEQLLSRQVINQVLMDPPELFNPESLEWLEGPLRQNGIIRDQSIDHLLVAKFKQLYSKIRMFHACRPEDIGGYLRDGLVPLNSSLQAKRARKLFLSNQFPGVDEAAVERAIQETGNEKREGRLYLSIDVDRLTSFGMHYLVYGSEYLTAVAKSLERNTGADCLDVLRTIGTPTVFECDVPIAYIAQSKIESLVGNIVSLTFQEKVQPTGEAPSIDFTFEFSTQLPASVIRSHYHPSRLIDPLVGNRPYIANALACPYCQGHSSIVA